jgi:hypothetical protein
MKWSVPILLVALVMATSVRADPCSHKPPHAPQCRGPVDFPLYFTGPIANANPSIAGYATPQRNPVPPPVDQTLFQAVYNLLQPSRNDVNIWLCSLTNLFVQTSGTQDFGIWEVPGGTAPGGPQGGRHASGGGGIHIAVRPLASINPLKLADQENMLLAAALGVPSSSIAPGGLLPWFTSVDTPAQGMALLSILAHELGHLLLAETNADGTGNNNYTHGRSHLCDKPGNRPSANVCFDTYFVPPTPGTTLWNPTYFYPGMRRWITFSDRNGNMYQDTAHELGRVRGLVNAPLDPNDLSSANAAINDLLTSEFVSLFAAMSPEEDFVETYKYQILANVAQASNLTLNYPDGATVLVLNKVVPKQAGNHLQAKVSCVNSLTQ